MTTPSNRNIRWLLEQLEDPFTMFPVEHVADTLFEAVDDAELQKNEIMDPWWGVDRKFWTVEQEHHHGKIGLLIGTIFVLGQAMITQTLSILNELRKEPLAQRVIPIDKPSKMIANAGIENKTNISKILIINAVSNYFKHVYEWPEHWNTTTGTGVQAETARVVLQLGMRPGEITPNLLLAADCLELHSSNPRALARTIQEWRERWARVLYPSFMLTDPSTE